MRLKIENYCLPLLFLLGRLILILSLSYEGLLGYGDLTHYYRVAALGTPMVDVWIEYPPIFAFISRWLYLLFSGRESSFVYSLVILFSIAQATSLLVFNKLFALIYPQKQNDVIPIIYFTLLCFIPFGWWQFDSLAVLAMLLGLFFFLKEQDGWASIYTVLGILLKIFPIFLLPMAIKTRSFWRNVLLVCLILGCVAIVMGGLYLISPQMTSASWIAQMSKGSWETVWALIDGNLTTGSFGPLVDRFTPESAAESLGNPARIRSEIKPGFIYLRRFDIICEIPNCR